MPNEFACARSGIFMIDPVVLYNELVIDKTKLKYNEHGVSNIFMLTQIYDYLLFIIAMDTYY